MDRQTAMQIIGNTFNYPLDEGRFRNFALNLLNDIDEQKGFYYLSGTYIHHSFKNHIANTDVWALTPIQMVKNEWALERS